MKHKNHDNILNNFEEAKKKHLEKLANIMLKKDEFFSKLREKNISIDFSNLFGDGNSYEFESKKYDGMEEDGGEKRYSNL